MQKSSFWLVHLSLATAITARPPPTFHDDPQQVTFTSQLSDKDNDASSSDSSSIFSDTAHTALEADMVALLDKYAPVFKLSEAEAYFPSSIKYMLDHYDFIEYKDGSTYIPDPIFMTPSDLSFLPHNGSGQLLSVSAPHNPQPFLFDDESEFLYGPAGQDGGMERDEEGRGIVEEDVYGFWVDQGRGIVDLWYWTFYPFNFGKVVGSFGVLGNHVGDWEHLRVRTINRTAVSVDYNAHSGDQYGAGTLRWHDVPKIQHRPVGYVAAGSHGVWPMPGDHVYAQVGRRPFAVFKLVDMTDDDGPVWDTKGHVVPIPYWYGPDRGHKVTHHGDLGWVDYRGQWGNRGVNDCWWHRIVDICQIVDGPPGPNRNFGIPPDCIVAPAAWEMSTYTFYLSSLVAQRAELRGVAVVTVDQICVKPRKEGDPDDEPPEGAGVRGNDEDDDDDDDDEEVDDEYEYEYDYNNEAKYEIWTVSGSTAFVGTDQHSVTTLPCSGSKSAARAYKVSLCMSNGRCISTSQQRNLCAYEPGKNGYTASAAVKVDDIDDWRWEV